MKSHEREFFISLIRSGKIFVSKDEIDLEIRPLTIDQSVKSMQVYLDAYDKALSEELMTEDDVSQWMLENELWTHVDDKKVESFNKDIEKLKVEIYSNRTDEKLVKKIRMYLRAGEAQLTSFLNKKHAYYSNTCEGIAATEKLCWILKNSTYYKNKLYDFSNISLEYVTNEFQSSFLSERKLRELARNDPWKAIWIIRGNVSSKLFANPDNAELTYNQKNLIIWSQMYDNIQESMDCPNDDVIEDDDMLDGWFILQRKKREKEKLERELDDNIKSDKIKNANEVFIVPKSDNDIERIDSLNDLQGQVIKKQREAFLTNHIDKAIEDHKLPDRQREIQMQMNNSMRIKK